MSCSSLGGKTVTSNLPSRSWSCWIAHRVAWDARSRTRTHWCTCPSSCVKVWTGGPHKHDHQTRPRTCAWSSDAKHQRQWWSQKVRGTRASCQPSISLSHRASQPRSCVPGSSNETSQWRYKCAVRMDHPCILWLVRHQAWRITQNLVKPCGRTPCET